MSLRDKKKQKKKYVPTTLVTLIIVLAVYSILSCINQSPSHIGASNGPVKLIFHDINRGYSAKFI